MKKFYALVLLVSLAGCGHMIANMGGIPVVNPVIVDDVKKHTNIEHDQYKDLTIVKGPIIFPDGNVFGNTYFLRVWLNKRGDIDLAQLYVTANLDGWYFLDSAHQKGKSLDFTKISRDVGSCSQYGCSVSETIGINFTKKELENYAEALDDFNVKISGNKGSIILSVPRGYFEGVINALPKK